MWHKLLFISRYAAVLSLGLSLAGCTVSSSILGSSIAGIGAGKAPENLMSDRAGTGSASGPTGSIVPLRDEAAVVDLPDSGREMQASSADQGTAAPAETQVEPAEHSEHTISPQERHRRELINRGDLQEGQPLPVE